MKVLNTATGMRMPEVTLCRAAVMNRCQCTYTNLKVRISVNTSPGSRIAITSILSKNPRIMIEGIVVVANYRASSSGKTITTSNSNYELV